MKKYTGVMAMKDYQAAMLLAYPRAEKLIENLGQLADAKAYGSYSGREATEVCVARILSYLHARDCFAVLRDKVDEVLSQLTREERYLLEYKYFRRRKVLEGEFADMQCAFSARTYYRRQRRLEGKLNSLFLRGGADRAWFRALFSDIAYMRSLVEGVRRGDAMTDKRAHATLRVRGGNGVPAERAPARAKEEDRSSVRCIG